MEVFLNGWAEAARTSLGFFWMALWAFALGYIISSLIQVFVTERRMQRTMGSDAGKSMLLGTFFGFISSSCSFAALATTKSLFAKGARFTASLAFLLASTNLVIELGIIISIFLGWQFVVGEYLGGVLLILVSYVLVRVFRPDKLISRARENLKNSGEKESEKHGQEGIEERMTTGRNWGKVGRQYGMEWKMVWKDVTLGFTIAGVVAAFVPDAFFRQLFINSGQGAGSYSFLTVVEHILVGPVAAFLTFIGSMGNIPLAALLFGKGVSFGGVMAFIFSDLVVFPVLRINARYYGWKMSLFILLVLFISLFAAALALHYGFQWSGFLPDPDQVRIGERDFFKVDYTFYLNLVFAALSGILLYFGYKRYKDLSYHKEMAPKSRVMERTLKILAFVSFFWVAAGVVLWILGYGS